MIINGKDAIHWSIGSLKQKKEMVEHNLLCHWQSTIQFNLLNERKFSKPLKVRHKVHKLMVTSSRSHITKIIFFPKNACMILLKKLKDVLIQGKLEPKNRNNTKLPTRICANKLKQTEFFNVSQTKSSFKRLYDSYFM